MLIKYRFPQGRKITLFSLALGASFVIGLSLLLCLGPALQNYSLALLTSNHVDAYAIVNGEDLVPFVEISEWVSWSNILLYSFVSVLFLFIVRNKSESRSIFYIAIVYFFFMLTAVDFVFALFYPPVNFLQYSLQCVAANFIGAPLIAGYIVLIGRAVYEILAAHHAHTVSEKFIALTCPLAVGSLTTFLAYYICAMFLNPTSTEIDAIVMPPVRGVYSSANDKNHEKSTKDGVEKFGLFEKNTSYDAVIRGTSFDKSIQLKWNQSAGNSRYTLKVYLLSGCDSPEAMKIAETSPAQFEFDDVSRIEVFSDPGFSIFYAKPDPGTSLGMRLEGLDSNSFYIIEGEEKGKFNAGRMLEPSSKMELWTNQSGYQIFLSSYLVGKIGGASAVRQAKRFRLVINSLHYEFEYEDNKKFDFESNPVCRNIMLRPVVPRVVTKLPKVDGAAGFLVKLSRERKSSIISFEPEDVMEVSGFQGWVNLVGLSSSQLATAVTPGNLKKLAYGDGLSDIKLNGVKQDVVAGDTFAISGAQLTGMAGKNGEMHFRGKAGWVWKNERRYSKTRWERIDSSVKLLLLSGVFTGFGSLFYLVVNSFRSKRQIKLI